MTPDTLVSPVAAEGTEVGTGRSTDGFPPADIDPVAPAGSTHAARNWLVALISYLPLAAVAFLPSWIHWSQQMNGCNCWDQVLDEWGLASVSTSLPTGHLHLTTSLLDVPGGVNLMWNTTMPLLGALTAPLQHGIGVVRTFAIVEVVGFALSASAMFALLRVWTGQVIGPWAGGLAYGFSCYAVVEASGAHANLVFNPVLPLVLLVVTWLVTEPGPRVVRRGIQLGLLLVAQLLVSPEQLAVFAVILAPGLITVVLLRRGMARRVWGACSKAAGWALGVFAVLGAYPMWVMFFGPYQFTGAVQSPAQLAQFSSDLTSIVLPTRLFWLAPGVATTVSDRFDGANLAEVTGYLGLTLVVVMVMGVIWLRRKPLVVAAGVTAVVSYLCSLGPRVLVAGHHTGVPGPDAVLTHVPILDNITPARFDLGLALGSAVVLGFVLAEIEIRWSRRGERGGHSRHSSSARRGHLVALLVAAVALFPLLPAWPYASVPASVPAFFSTGAVAKAVPAGSVVAVYPVPREIDDQAMLWQAVSGMRFRQPGGFIIARGPGGTASFFADPTTVEACFDGLYIGGSGSAAACQPVALVADLNQLHVSRVIVPTAVANAAVARSVVTRAVGEEPVSDAGVLLWSCRSTSHRVCRWTSPTG